MKDGASLRRKIKKGWPFLAILLFAIYILIFLLISAFLGIFIKSKLIAKLK